MTNPIQPVLLVEDNPMDVDLTRRAFARRRLANPLEVVRDGREALDYLERSEQSGELPVVILLDLKLPKLGGLDVLQHVKASAVLRAVPVVVLTTSREDRDVQTAYELGANSYIVKPVDFENFIEVVTQIEAYWLVLNLQQGPA
jgi:CheY-like chemotaxis protein